MKLKIWLMPMLIAGFTLMGLLFALSGSGIWYGISWFCLAQPFLWVAFFLSKNNRIAKGQELKQMIKGERPSKSKILIK